MRAWELVESIKKEIKTFTCRWCKKDFESEFGQFCPHCSRFQDHGKKIVFEKTLYHGTSRKRSHDVKKYGLIPDVGSFVKQMYDEPGVDFEDLVFATDKEQIGKAVTAMMSAIEHDLGKDFHDVTEDEILKYGAIVVIKYGDESFYNRDIDDENYYGDYPTTVEPGDYYSRDNEEIDYILTGKKLIAFLRKHNFWPIPYPMFDASKAKREQLIRLGKKLYPEQKDEILNKVMGLSDKDVEQLLKVYTKEFSNIG